MTYIHKIYEPAQKIKDKKSFHLCTKEDFYFLLDKSEEEVKNGKVMCLDREIMKSTVEGEYIVSFFEFFQLRLNFNNPGVNTDKTLSLLKIVKCKFQYYSSVYAIDAHNIEDPVQIYLTQNFIQLSAAEVKNINLFFDLKEFQSYENYIFDILTPKTLGVFSLKEEYSDFKRTERFTSNIRK